MRFLLDENFPKTAVSLLRTHGHDCDDVRELGLGGSSDVDLLSEAQRLDAVFVTTDRDFFHTLHPADANHAGIIVIALKKPNRSAILARLEWLLKNLRLDDLRGRAIQLRDRTWLSRPPLNP